MIIIGFVWNDYKRPVPFPPDKPVYEGSPESAGSVLCRSCCQFVALLDQGRDLAPVQRGRVDFERNPAVFTDVGRPVESWVRVERTLKRFTNIHADRQITFECLQDHEGLAVCLECRMPESHGFSHARQPVTDPPQTF